MPEITAPEKSLRDWDRLNEHDDEPADPDCDDACDFCDYSEECREYCLVRPQREMDATSKFFFDLAEDIARMERGF